MYIVHLINPVLPQRGLPVLPEVLQAVGPRPETMSCMQKGHDLRSVLKLISNSDCSKVVSMRLKKQPLQQASSEYSKQI
jgi:hypothetical protein